MTSIYSTEFQIFQHESEIFRTKYLKVHFRRTPELAVGQWACTSVDLSQIMRYSFNLHSYPMRSSTEDIQKTTQTIFWLKFLKAQKNQNNFENQFKCEFLDWAVGLSLNDVQLILCETLVQEKGLKTEAVHQIQRANCSGFPHSQKAIHD